VACDESAHWQILLWMHLGQFLNGLSGPVAMMSGPVLSAAWFPPSFRTTSTAIVAVFNGLGVAFSNYVGPALVGTHASAAEQQRGMALYLWGCTIASVVILAAMLICKIAMLSRFVALPVSLTRKVSLADFPNKPPNTPSVTAGMARTGQGEGMAGFCQGARDLCRHKNWWLLATACERPATVRSLPSPRDFLSLTQSCIDAQTV